MEKQQTFLAVIKTLVWAVFVFFFVFFVFQYNNMEQRVIDLQNKLDQLKTDSTVAKESLQLIMGEISGVKRSLKSRVSNPIVQKDKTQPVQVKPVKVEPKKGTRKYLNPEVKNFLEPDPFSYVCKKAVDEGKINGTLTRRWASDPKGFNFVLENDGSLNNKLYKLCLEPMAFAHWNDPDKLSPRLAERIEILDDYKTWIFYIRKGVRWHRPVGIDWQEFKWLKDRLDKEEPCVTAHDFAFYLDMVRHPQVEAGHLKNYYANITEYKVIDDYTIIVKWKEKQYQSLSTMTEMFRPVPTFIYKYDKNGKEIPKENIGLAFNNHWFNHNFVGCGPYKFVSYEPGVSIKLTRNESYWGDKPQLKNIVYLIYRDRKQVLLKMKSKEQNFCETIDPDYIADEKKKKDSPFATGDITVGNVPVVGYIYIAWNAENPLFSDKKVRHAMTQALNREDLLANVSNGNGIPTTACFYPLSRAYNKNIKPLPFDLQQSAKLLEECGWKDSDNDGIRDKIIKGEKTKFEFSLLVWNTSPTWQTIAKIYKEDLYKIGVKMTIRALDWAVFLKKMENKEFDAFTGYWLISYGADPYQIWHSSQADVPKGSNRVGFRNKRADEIIETARRTFDPDKRAKLFNEFHKIIHEEQPYTFCWCPIDKAVWWKEVKNVVLRKERPHTFPLPYYIDK